MMLADPGFVEPQPVQPLHQLEIALDAGRRIFVHRMKRWQEDAVTQWDTWHVALRIFASLTLPGLSAKRPLMAFQVDDQPGCTMWPSVRHVPRRRRLRRLDVGLPPRFRRR